MKTLDQLIRIGLIIELELHSRFCGGLKQYYKVKSLYKKLKKIIFLLPRNIVFRGNM